MTECAMCGQEINGLDIVAEGPSTGNPGVKFYHIGCVRRRERQRIASSTPDSLTEEAGERI